MIPRTVILFLGVALSAQVLHAGVPKAQPASRYKVLWENSRLTSKPPPPEVEEEEAVFEDYALLAVTPMAGRYMVSIRHKKDAEQSRVRIFPGEQNANGFAVIGVEQSPSDPMETKVKLSYKGKQGIVEYDEKFLALKAPPLPSKGKAPAKTTPPRPGAKNVPNRPTTTTTTNRTQKTGVAQLPPGMQAAGTTGATQNKTTTPSTTRKPRVRRVPTPPTR